MVDVTQFALFPAAVPADLIARAARVNPAWRLVMECDEIALHGNGAVAAWKDAEDCRVWLSKQTVKKDDDDND